MTVLFLTNEALKDFIEELKISRERKDFLISKVPQLDLKERINLFDTLKEIHFLDLEEEEAISRVEKYWQE